MSSNPTCHKILYKTPQKNQESIAWIQDCLSCSPFIGKNGSLVFKFTNYLVKYIHSIYPNFDDTGIDKAFYATSNNLGADDPESSQAFIYVNKPEAAFQIERILHDKNVADMFPGIFF